MSDGDRSDGMTPQTALKLEYAIIGLGILALVLIFQPFNILLFAIGCILVVVAGLANNLLPLAQAGVRLRSVATVAMTIVMIFCIVLLVAIFAANLYGTFFLKPPDPDTIAGRIQLGATPWYLHPFTWTVAVVACLLAFAINFFSRRN